MHVPSAFATVVSDILGHSKVNLTMDVHDPTDAEDFVQPLSVVFNELLPRTFHRVLSALKTKELVSAEGIELEAHWRRERSGSRQPKS